MNDDRAAAGARRYHCCHYARARGRESGAIAGLQRALEPARHDQEGQAISARTQFRGGEVQPIAHHTQLLPSQAQQQRLLSLCAGSRRLGEDHPSCIGTGELVHVRKPSGKRIGLEEFRLGAAASRKHVADDIDRGLNHPSLALAVSALAQQVDDVSSQCAREPPSQRRLVPAIYVRGQRTS